MKKSLKMISIYLCISLFNLFLIPHYSFAGTQVSNFQLTQKGGLQKALYQMNSDERRILGNILWKVDEIDERLSIDEITPDSIQNKLMFVYGNAFTCWFSKFRDVPYSDIVVAVAENLDITTKGKSLEQLELEVLTTHTRTLWDSLTEKQKKETTQEVIQQLQNDNIWDQLDEKTKDTIIKHGPVAALMVLMEYGGFATYRIILPIILKTVAAIAGVLGITLAFGTYGLIATVTSKVLSVLLGPVGWGILAASAFWHVFDTNYEKLTAFVEAFAILRLADN